MAWISVLSTKWKTADWQINEPHYAEPHIGEVNRGCWPVWVTDIDAQGKGCSLRRPTGIKLLSKPVLPRSWPSLLGSTIILDMTAYPPSRTSTKWRYFWCRSYQCRWDLSVLPQVGPFVLQKRRSCLPCPLLTKGLHQTFGSHFKITLMLYHCQQLGFWFVSLFVVYCPISWLCLYHCGFWNEMVSCS